MSCASAVTVATNYCIAIKPAPIEVVEKLATVKTPEAKAWVVNFNKLYKAWENKTLCATVTYLDRK